MLTYGPFYPTSVSLDTSNGGTMPWSVPDNIKTENGLSSYVNIHGGNQLTEIIKAAFDLSSIPDDAMVVGLLVEWKKKRQVGLDCVDRTMQLYVCGVLSGDNKAVAGMWPVSLTWVPYGSATDLFGIGPISVAVLKDSGFSVGLSTQETAGDSIGTAYLDACRLTVFTA